MTALGHLRGGSGWILSSILSSPKSGDAVAQAAQGAGIHHPGGIPECGDVEPGDMINGHVGAGVVLGLRI